MKIRNGFVSNSSSSSFIIKCTFEEQEPCTCCGRSFENPLDVLNLMVEGSYDDTPFLSILNVPEGEDDYGSYAREWFNDHPEYADAKEHIFYGEVSYHNQARVEYLRNHKDIEILAKDY